MAACPAAAGCHQHQQQQPHQHQHQHAHHRAPCGGEASTSTPRCSRCGNAGKLNICGSCHAEIYCSVACQRADWPEHRERCLSYAAVHEAYSQAFDNSEDFALLAVGWITQRDFDARMAVRERRLLDATRLRADADAAVAQRWQEEQQQSCGSSSTLRQRQQLASPGCAAAAQRLPMLPPLMSVACALLPYKGGQWLMLSFSYSGGADASPPKQQGVRWLCADPKGAELLLPQQGGCQAASSAASSPVSVSTTPSSADSSDSDCGSSDGCQGRPTTRALAFARQAVAAFTAALHSEGLPVGFLKVGSGLAELNHEVLGCSSAASSGGAPVAMAPLAAATAVPPQQQQHQHQQLHAVEATTGRAVAAPAAPVAQPHCMKPAAAPPSSYGRGAATAAALTSAPASMLLAQGVCV